MRRQLKIVSVVCGLTLLWGCSTAPATEVSQVQSNTSPAATNTATPIEQDTPATPTTANKPDAAETLTTEARQAEATSESGDSNNVEETPPAVEPTPVDTPTSVPTEASPEITDAGIVADVLSAEAKGEPGRYNFSVEISSPDTGCEQFADWWEVLSEDGRLLYRRILLHSHVDEQPFVRSGGPVEITADDIVWVRAHMNTGGYGGQVLKGSPATGFEPAEPPPNFAADAESLAPLPSGCGF